MKSYRISIGKSLEKDLEDWFEDCNIESGQGITYLHFSTSDQARLFGLLGVIQNLGLPLLEVEILKNQSQGE